MKSKSKSKKVGGLFEEEKLVRVEKGTAEGLKAFLFHEGLGSAEFVVFRLALIDELIGDRDILGPRGKLFGLFEEEGAVEEVKGLEWRGASWAAGADLASIRGVEGGENGVGFHAEFQGVDHAAVVFALEVAGFSDPVAGVVGIWLVKHEAGAAGGEIEAAGDGEDAVADDFGIQATRGKAPEQRVRRVFG